MGLAELLEIRPGVTAVIGGGGKTTLLRTLGSELSSGHSVLLCTTTKIFPFPDLPCARTEAELEVLRRDHRLLCAGTPVPGTGKLTAPLSSMAKLADVFDYVLVEADGSAQRPIKAHALHEPVIPRETAQTILVVGASGFGQPIAQAAHRPERYAQIVGLPQEASVTPETEAAVLIAEALHDKIYVNQVEAEQDRRNAAALAGLLACPVLAGSLRRGEYLLC
ncbi:selenium cofactor biosynthesis protein YqeC [uncultured Dysosmobacter sp.]|uniref:selenium cofactor biosynthesis protein YqeC n=1 Tax=uncultured Dysosmobacter sp. TaxID=2591384 RepID=UPI0026113E58|nr:selenium cofactor biosynthesis protein YqeC [uncultured Dysosmobacter sp.]